VQFTADRPERIIVKVWTHSISKRVHLTPPTDQIEPIRLPWLRMIDRGSRVPDPLAAYGVERYGRLSQRGDPPRLGQATVAPPFAPDRKTLRVKLDMG
jgi:hypothetical protein